MQQPGAEGQQDQGPPGVGRVSAAMRSVLTLASVAWVGMARRIGMSVNDLLAIEHVMTAEVGVGDLAVGPTELSRLLGVTTAATTQSLHRLEASGYVRRLRHPDDGRRQVIEVTPQGAQRVFAALSPLLELLDAQTVQLSDVEQQAVLKFLTGQQVAYHELLAHLGETAQDDRRER